MKIKNLKINKELVSMLLSATMLVGTIGGGILYYQYENKEQVYQIDIDSNNIFVDENGEFYCYFDIGEHIITISRNDLFYYKNEEIEGYAIKEIEIDGWSNNNKITYVNTETVVVVATKEENGQLQFNDFGIVSSKKNIVKK